MLEKPECTIPGFYTRTLSKNIPFNTIFELTYRCNLKCRQCYIVNHGQKELSYKEITRILDQLVEANTLYLTFSGGEILMRNDFFDIANYAKKKGFALKLFSNGTLINENIAARIADLKPISVGISVYGADASTHEYYTDVPGSFERSLQALQLLRSMGVVTVIKYLLMKKNISQVVAMKRLSMEIDAIPHFDPIISPKNDGDRSPLEHQISDEDMYNFYHGEVRDEEPDQKKNSPDAIICRAGRDFCSISPNGDVFPCITMPVKIGNLSENSFHDIWHGEAIEQIRSYRFNDVPECLNCADLDDCVRCWGLALIESGDLFGPSRLNCRVARVRHRVSIERGEN